MFFLKELPTRQVLERYHASFPAMQVDTIDRALRMLRTASLLLRELEAYFATHRLSQARFLVLVVLDREEDRDGLRISQVAERIDVARPVMTRTLQSLSAAGLVRFREDEADARSRHVLLTAKGRRRLHDMLPGYYRTIDAFMKVHDAAG
ncbi:MarR family winged helix-turn-helix transcriptional regulator [Anaeromyxobacter sp. Red801]|uniref:MarR family winged helix-turn-helix transcriptional regulator n=1 Tax=Anaeromyxobacter sp. Red801 TaxID=3411632 RepID=UPI003B9F606E